MKKMEAAQVDTLTRKGLTDKCKAWAQGYPLNLFCGSDGKEVFTREDLRTSFTAGIEQYLRSICAAFGITQRKNYLKKESGVFCKRPAVFGSLCDELRRQEYAGGG